MSSRARSRGFTLVELIITLVIAGILVTVGVPNFQNYIANNRVKTASQTLFTSLMYARSEALKRNGSVYVYPRDSDDDWSMGWTVTSQAGNKDCSAGCLQTQTPSGVSVITGATQVVYRGDGSVGATATFEFCDTDASSSVTEREITIDLTGRATLDTDGACS